MTCRYCDHEVPHLKKDGTELPWAIKQLSWHVRTAHPEHARMAVTLARERSDAEYEPDYERRREGWERAVVARAQSRARRGQVRF